MLSVASAGAQLCLEGGSDTASRSDPLARFHSVSFSPAGKSFLCSTIGCEGSFSSMQQLMDHMRHHHKPNYFFLCVAACRAVEIKQPEFYYRKPNGAVASPLQV